MSVCAADMRWALLLWILKNCIRSEGRKIQRLSMCCQVVWKPSSHGITCTPSRLVSVYSQYMFSCFSVHFCDDIGLLGGGHSVQPQSFFAVQTRMFWRIFWRLVNITMISFIDCLWSEGLWHLFHFCTQSCVPMGAPNNRCFSGHFCDDIGVVCFWRDFFDGGSTWIWYFSLIFDLLRSQSSWHLFHFYTQSCFLMRSPNNCCKTSMVL